MAEEAAFAQEYSSFALGQVSPGFTVPRVLILKVGHKRKASLIILLLLKMGLIHPDLPTLKLGNKINDKIRLIYSIKVFF